MIPIDSWRHAYVALQQTAGESRGVELDGGPDPAARWPRTIGADVVAIAALIHPVLQRVPYGFGGQALARRWLTTTLDMERVALGAPRAIYPENRSFWSTLSAACVYLDAEGAPLPRPPFWSALLGQLGDRLDPRNAGPSGDGPFKHFDAIKTFDDLYTAQLKHLRDLRGSDDVDPDPGMMGGKRPIPRSTNGDVVQLADYWSRQLASVKRVMGANGVEQRWRTALVDVDAIARTGDAHAVYPKNNAFWRALQTTAVHVAVADEAPSKTDLMIDSLKDSIVHLPDNLKAGAKAIASGAANLAGNVAKGVGHVANEAGKGLFSGFGTPLLVGAGLVGLFLLSRNSRETTEA